MNCIYSALEHGSDVNSLTTESVTPLHDAVDRGDISIIEVLLKANASPVIKAERGKFEGMSPLELAVRKPEIFAVISQYLANQFKAHRMTTRASSIDSVTLLSPTASVTPYMEANETAPLRTRRRHTSCSSDSFQQSLHHGFDPVISISCSYMQHFIIFNDN